MQNLQDSDKGVTVDEELYMEFELDAWKWYIMLEPKLPAPP